MIIDTELQRDGLFVSYFDKDGINREKKFKVEPGKFPGWKVCSSNSKHKSSMVENWDGRAVKPVTKDRMNKFETYEFIENLPQEEKDEILCDTFPKIASIDIETEIVDGFPNPDIAKEKITAIAITTTNHKCIVLGLDPLSNRDQIKVEKDINDYLEQLGENDFKFKHQQFDSEYDMLNYFLKRIVPNVGLLTGWFFLGFDWPYIVKRSKNLGLEPSESSPTNQYMWKSSIPKHIAIKDYLKVFKNWDKSVGVKENNKLDYVAEQVLNINKINYQGTLQDLYEQDYKRYVFYNAIDAILVLLIHENLRTLDTVLSVSNSCNISFYKAESPVSLTEALMFKTYYQRGQVIADYSEPGEKGNYEGAYVKEPVPGLYNMVMMCDLASQYPSVMRQFNISPESYVEKVTDEERRKEYEEDENYIVAKNGCVFGTDNSVLKELLTELFNNRKQNKNHHLDLEMEIAELEQRVKD